MITFKRNDEIILQTDFESITPEKIDEMEKRFDEQEILKYEVEFKSGSLVKIAKNLGNLDQDDILGVTITLR
jgi:hypothetical protein